jgi:hypothetical protein
MSPWAQLELDLLDVRADEVALPPCDARALQHLLFDPAAYHWTAPHWEGMPPMIQPDARPRHHLVVHFRTQADRQAFAALLGQPLTPRTRSLWYPPMPAGRLAAEQIVETPP